MREILFRAKRIDGKEWVEGYFVSLNDCPVIVLKEAAERFSIEMKRMLKSHDMIMVVPETVCQYTGLSDKNGKKIFEGDILSAYIDIFEEGNKVAETRVIMEWNNYSCCLKDTKTGISDTIKDSCLDAWEIIGNIFDNPELIGENDE